MLKRLETAGKQLISWILEGRVKAGGHPYEFSGAPVISDSYTEIPAEFLRSGVYCEPITDMLLTDPTIGEEWGQFVHENTRGYAMVTLDESKLKECVQGTKSAALRSDLHIELPPMRAAGGGQKAEDRSKAPPLKQKGKIGAPKGSGEIDDTAHITEAQRLLADGACATELAAAQVVAANAKLGQKDIERIRKKLAKARRSAQSSQLEPN
jgi:hypothetical protein